MEYYVMMGRRRDEAYSSSRIPSTSDWRRNLVSWKFTSFSWPRPLSHFDLELVSIGQIISSDSEVTRCNLFNSRTHGIPVRQVLKSFCIFTSLTSIWFASQSVQGNSEGRMASIEMEPYDMAPITNLQTMSFQGSTCSIGMGVVSSKQKSRRPRKVIFRTCSVAFPNKRHKKIGSFLGGSLIWASPPSRQWYSPDSGTPGGIIVSRDGHPHLCNSNASAARRSNVVPCMWLAVPMNRWNTSQL